LAQGKKNDFEAICAKLEKSRGAAPGAAALRALGLSREGKHADALRILDDELARAPRHPIVVRARAQVLFASGERGEKLDESIRVGLEVAPLCVRVRAVASKREA